MNQLSTQGRNYTGWHSPGAVVNKDAGGRNPTIFEKMPFPTGSCALLRTDCPDTYCDGLQGPGTACDSEAWWSHKGSSFVNGIMLASLPFYLLPSENASNCPLSGKHSPHPTTKFTRTLFLDFLSSKTTKRSLYINYSTLGIPLSQH